LTASFIVADRLEDVALEAQQQGAAANFPEEGEAEFGAATRLLQRHGNEIVREGIKCTGNIQFKHVARDAPSSTFLEDKAAALAHLHGLPALGESGLLGKGRLTFCQRKLRQDRRVELLEVGADGNRAPVFGFGSTPLFRDELDKDFAPFRNKFAVPG
jgi:hypothetical protein